MNRGLKTYTKQLALQVGNAAEASININKEDANLHITLPLITTVGLCPIETSLVFNLQNKNSSELFGKGWRLNFYSNIFGTAYGLSVKNFDGSVDNYLSVDDYYNKETGLEVKKINDNRYGTIYHYEVKDKYGNMNRFDNTQNYPTRITYKNGDEIITNFVSEVKVISNGKGDEIRFTKNGNQNVTKIEYYHNDSLVNTVELSYTSSGNLYRLIYKNGTTTVATTTLYINSSDITVLDNLSDYRIRFNIEDQKVVSFKDGYDTPLTNGHLTTIQYNDKFTKVTDYRGNNAYTFFDTSNLPLFEMDDEGNVIETEYDKETKVLKSNSGVVETNRVDNLLGSGTINSFTNNGLIIEAQSVNDPLFSSVLGSTVYKVSGTGTLTKRIDVTGLATDNIMALLFGKQLTPKTNTDYVKVTLTCDKVRSSVFSKTEVDNLFDLMTLGLSSTKSYNYIEIKIELFGNSSIILGGVQVINKEFGSFYTYDDFGNATGVGNGATSTSISYGANNLPSSTVGADSSMFDYEYDDYGNLTKATSAYGVKIENTFDTVHKGNLLSNKVCNSDETKILKTSKTYTSDGRFILTDTDELGNTTTYNEYDSFGKVKKVTNALNAVSEFNYNADGTLNQIILHKNSNSVRARYEYDYKKRISKVTLDNGSCYKFIYDSKNNLKQIKHNDVVVFEYDYNQVTGALEVQKYGSSSDAFKFEYNEDGVITKIKYASDGVTFVDKYNYLYNSKKELIKITNANNEILNEYIYDNGGKLITIKTPDSEINKVYDNLGNVVSKRVTVSDNKVYTSYDTVSRSKGSHPESLYEPYTNSNCYIGTFEKDKKLKYRNEILRPVGSTDSNIASNIGKEGIIPYVHVSSNNRLSYKLECANYYPDPSGCIQFWFKSDTVTPSSTKKFLFTTKTSNTNYSDFIGVYLLNKRICVEVVDYSGTHHNLLASDYEVDLSKWNFVSLDVLNRYDGQGYDDICEYALTVNAHMQIFKKKNPRIYVDCGPQPVVCIGHQIDDNACHYDFTGKIACLMLSKRRYITLKEVLKYYRLTKDYIVDNQLVDEDVQTVDFSQTNLFTTNQDILNSFEIYPLQNSVISLTGKKPVYFNIRNVSSLDKDRTFNFNNLIKRYAYVADGEALVYNFNQPTSGTIAMRAFTDVQESKQYFFEGKDSIGQILGLFRNSENKVCVYYNGAIVNTNLEFTTNEWHTICFSYEQPRSSYSQLNRYLNVRVIVDDNEWHTSLNRTTMLEYLSFSIGRRYMEDEISSNFGGYETSYPLYGQIEMLATRAAYCELSTLNTLKEELKGLTKVNEFDELGMLKKIDVHKCGTSILSNTYEYKTRDNDSRYISKLVAKETIKVPNQTIERNYTYDALGNVTSINDSTFGSHEYRYDYRGFLISADNQTYTYDGNGNITQMGDKTLTYDSVIKDRLVSIDGTPIIYNTNNPLNPSQYGDYSYLFEGRRLEMLNDGNDVYSYVYNDQGLRIEKKMNGQIINKYIYDGDKLVTDIVTNYRLDFLYDENGMLYGFIKDNTDKYFYIRDCMQNIIGITVQNGEIVVKYNYDAWGKLLSTIDTSSSGIGILNPFRYKGYYYDQESKMYYCKSRYYVPEWGRWLNADNPSFLQPENLNANNLFCYCNNNPILGADPTGFVNWWKFAAIALAAVVVVAAVAVTVVTCGAGSVAATIAITSAITFAAKATEVGVLQYKKSKADGDSGAEIFSDIVDAIFGNGAKIIGATPLTKLGGFVSGFYSQSSIFAYSLQLMKLDGFHLSTFLGSSWYSICNRFKHFGDYMSMSTSKFGYVVGYGFALYNVGWTIGAAVSDDYEWIADFRGYKLY